MKKVLISLLAIIIVVVVGLRLLGLSPSDLPANVAVGTGMGAKLGCSARFISGFEPARIQLDLTSYTPAADFIDLHFDDTARRVTASILGFGQTRATYRPGLGCTLDIGDVAHLDQVEAPSFATNNADWPAGEGSSAIRPDVQTALEQWRERDNAAGLDTRALVVTHNGVLVAEAYAAGTGADTPLLGWSMGKSLTSIMLGNLVLREELDLTDKPVFAAWAQDDRRDISLTHLLNMTSGLDFAEVYAPGSDATHMLFTATSAADVALASSLAHPPGSQFSYSSGTTNLLSRLFVQHHGGTQAALRALHEDLLFPLAMHHTYLEVDPAGEFVGSSYAYLSGRDWARLGQLMLNNGVLNGAQIVSPAWVAAAQQPNQSDNQNGYSYQFWHNRNGDQLRWPSLPEDTYAMMGNRQQRVMIIPSRKAVIVRLGWTQGRYPTDERVASLLNLI
ncbi:MAG: serine hydrolase [Pseudomonadota bacterium]